MSLVDTVTHNLFQSQFPVDVLFSDAVEIQGSFAALRMTNFIDFTPNRNWLEVWRLNR
jgi:hypothetical protein